MMADEKSPVICAMGLLDACKGLETLARMVIPDRDDQSFLADTLRGATSQVFSLVGQSITAVANECIPEAKDIDLRPAREALENAPEQFIEEVKIIDEKLRQAILLAGKRVGVRGL